MSSFDKKINNCAKLDFRILMNGSITLYNNKELLKDDIKRLQNNGYFVDLFDFNEISDKNVFHKQARKKLKFPDYYGESLPAFNDCLFNDLEIPEDSGRTIVLENFDKYYMNNEEYAHEILECLDLNSRRRMLFGERFFTLLHINNIKVNFREVGGHKVVWNINEHNLLN